MIEIFPSSEFDHFALLLRSSVTWLAIFAAALWAIAWVSLWAMRNDDPKKPHRFQLYPGEGAEQPDDRP